jgi:hypothetical protein
VFDRNAHARAVYERLGYAPEIIRYVKPLSSAAPEAPQETTD